MNKDELSDLVDKAMEGRGGQATFLAKGSIGEVFDALDKLKGIGVFVTLKEGVDESEPDQFPMMVYKEGEAPKIIENEEAMDEAEGDGWEKQANEKNAIVQREATDPHHNAGTIPAAPHEVAGDYPAELTPEKVPEMPEAAKPASPPITG
jgi:hypothetical protein